jgi:hypothetical protein
LLDWCRQGCGKSVHRACLKVWADHQASISKTLSCPFCRCSWGEPAPVSRARQSGGGASVASASRGERRGGNVDRARASGRRPTRWVETHCRSCRTCPVYGTVYRCLVCPDRPGERVELCSDCFGSGMHSHHPFGCRARASHPWVAAQERAPAQWQQAPPEPEIPHGGVPPHDNARDRTGDTPSVLYTLRVLQHRNALGNMSLLEAWAQVNRSAEQRVQQERASFQDGDEEVGNSLVGNPSVGNPSVHEALQQLQHREIGPEDFELLLSLQDTSSTPAGPPLVSSSTSREARRGGQAGQSGARSALPPPPLPLPPPPLSDEGAVQQLLEGMNERETLERDARAVEQQAAGSGLRLGRPLVGFGSSSSARVDWRPSAANFGDSATPPNLSLDFGLTGLSLGGSDTGLAQGSGPESLFRPAADGSRAVGHAGATAHRHRHSAVRNLSANSSTSSRLQRQPPNSGMGASSLECTVTSISSQASGRALPARSVSAGAASRRIHSTPGQVARGAVLRVDVAPSVSELVGLPLACHGCRPSS